jgi:hypothetical protein
MVRAVGPRVFVRESGQTPPPYISANLRRTIAA